ncbi:hypothetical protein RUND412_010371 [Rhizina undulata]
MHLFCTICLILLTISVLTLANPLPKNRFRPEKLRALRNLEILRERLGANWDLSELPPEFPWYEYANRVPNPEDYVRLRDPGIWLNDRVEGVKAEVNAEMSREMRDY